MTATSVLLILVGLFVIVNAPNFVGIFQGNKSLSFQGAKPTTSTSNASNPVTHT